MGIDICEYRAWILKFFDSLKTWTDYRRKLYHIKLVDQSNIIFTNISRGSSR